jgi:uncharacterized protein (DUF885 family)
MTAPADSAASEAFALADEAVDLIAALDPCDTAELGITSYEHLLTDYSPAGIEARRDLAASLLARAVAARAGASQPQDEQALDVMVERLRLDVERSDAGDDYRRMDVLTAAPFGIMMAFELMAPQRANTEARLAAVPDALTSWRAALVHGNALGHTAARRQVLAVARQTAEIGEGGFARMIAKQDGQDDLLADLAAAADAAYVQTARWLEEDFAPLALEEDAAGPEAYGRAVRYWLGEQIDLPATYEWGWAELRRLVAVARATAAEVVPGGGLAEAAAFLDASPQYTLEGEEALIAYLHQVTDEGFAVADRWFDIDPAIRRCDVRLAGPGSAAAPYYTAPSEDLARPGTTWYPTLGKHRFTTWQVRSTWFHEAVPGHHLQLATVMVERERLSRFQRVLGWTSGYGEGWALYAEQLMDELGGFPDPGTRLGFLAAQVMRAARVVIDIGLHCGLAIPADNGVGLPAGPWTPQLAEAVLRELALLAPDFAASEVDRYLGLPGQAIAYKVGERVWLDLRQEAKDRLGPDFDLRDWHMAALRTGHMGLEPLRGIMARYGEPAEGPKR